MGGGREAGQSLAEFALSLLVLAMVVLGLMDFSRAMLAHNTVANAAREGARYGVIHPDDTAKIKQAALALTVGLDNATVDVRRPASNVVEVVVTHTFHPVSLFVAGFLDDGSGVGFTMRARSRMYVEGK
jgi:Flp pilus assembly protein TadG